MKPRYVLALLALLAAATTASAQDSPGLKLSDLKAQGAAQLTRDQLQTLLPGAKVTSLTPTGSTRNWENSADGKLFASSDARGSYNRSGLKRSYSAPGTWHIGDDASYCVQLEWKSNTEQWCRFIFKSGEKYFGVKSVADLAATAYEFSFAR